MTMLLFIYLFSFSSFWTFYIEWLAYLVYVVTVTVNIFSGGHDTNISTGIHESMKIALLMVVIISCLENFSWKFCQLKSL